MIVERCRPMCRQRDRQQSGDGSVPYTLEDQLAMLLVDLQGSWNNNDRLLAGEGRSFYWGAPYPCRTSTLRPRPATNSSASARVTA